MNKTERDAVFAELQALQQVDIDHALERGKDYLMVRLMDCRRRQDRVGQISVSVKRALFAAKVARRNATALLKLSGAAGTTLLEYQRAHVEAENEYDEMKALEEATSVARGTLKVADSDIRLAANLLGIQIGLANPGSAPASDTAQPAVPSARTAEPAPAATSTVEEQLGSLDNFFADAAAPRTYSTKPDSATVEVGEVIDLTELLK